MSIRVSVTKSGTLREKLNAHRVSLIERVEAALMAAGEFVLGESRLLVPRDTEALVDSSGVRTEPGVFCFDVVVYYGRKGDFKYALSKQKGFHGEDRWVLRVPFEYAVYVHERMDKHHDVGQAKFLETVVMTRQDEIRALFNETVTRA